MTIVPLTDAIRREMFPRRPPYMSSASRGPTLHERAQRRAAEMMTAARQSRVNYLAARRVPNVARTSSVAYRGPRGRPVANSHRRWGTDPWVSEEAIEEPKGLSEVAMDLYVDNHDQVLRTARATARRYGLSPNLSESIEEKSLQILERCSREYRSGGSASFKTYLLSNITPTLRKECIRLSKRTGRASDSDWENLADNEQGPEDEISNDDLRKTLERLVRDLPPIERTLVQRHIGLEDMPKESIESIAADLGIHPAGARRSWSRALQHLKEALGEQGIEDADVLLSSGLGLVA